MQQTTGRTSQDKGLARTILGFPRSFIYFGNDGMLVKRYLVRDPFNPVTGLDILRLSLWKLILFYLFLAALGLNLLRSEQGTAAVGAAGVGRSRRGQRGGLLAWGRHRAPSAFVSHAVLAVGCVLCSRQSSRVLNYVVLIFLTAAAVTNLYAMSPTVLALNKANVAARISNLAPRLKPASRIFVVNFAG